MSTPSTPTTPTLPTTPSGVAAAASNVFNFSLPGSPSAPPIASPTFVTGPTDKLATADVYKAKPGVINSIQDSLKSAGISIPDVLKGGKALASLLPIIAGIKNGSLLQDRGALITRLLSSSSSITSAFKFLGTDAQNGILSSLKSAGSVAVTLNGVERTLQTTNFSDLTSIGRMVNTVTGDTTTMLSVDKDSQIGIFSGTIQEMTRLGIPNSFSALSATISDSTILRGTIGASLTSVIGASDVASLKAMSQAVGDGGIPLINAGTIGQFGNQFNRASAAVFSAAPKDDASTLSSVKDAFNSVDSAWNTCTRATSAGDLSTLSIAPLMGASPDFKTLIANGVKQADQTSTDPLMAISTLYQPTSVAQEISTAFPKVPTTTNVPTQQASAPSSSGIFSSLANLMPGLSFAYDPTTGQRYVPPTTSSQLNATIAAIPAATADTPTPTAVAPRPVAVPTPGTQIDPHPHVGYRDNRMIWDPEWGPIPADQTNEWALASWFDDESAKAVAQAQAQTTIN